jgi:hypothetical protein
MSNNKPRSRELKKKIHKILLQKDFSGGLAELSGLPARKAVNPLFSFLCSLDEKLKWRAVMAMGEIVAALAEDDLESARVIMRRLMWNLNDESGGMGWGCPEAMGEIMAKSETLAEEFWCILISYIRPDGNFLEHEALQRGVLWGVGRLAHARPRLIRNCAVYLLPYMQSDDPFLRGLSVWAAGAFCDPKTEMELKRLTQDHAALSIFLDGHMLRCSVSELAKTALGTSKI